jgi:hypothetical protein
MELLEFKKENIPEFMAFATDSYSLNGPFFLNGVYTLQNFNSIT